MACHARILRLLPTGTGLVSIAILTGCPLTPPPDPPEPTVLPRDSVDHAIEAYALAWTNKRLPDYQELLHANFEYFPQTRDLVEFPWLAGAPSWGRTEELGMAGNMFDEDFVGTTGQSIDSITMDLDIERETQVEGGVQVLVHADAQVLWLEHSGLRSEVRFEFLVVPDSDEPGLFQIREQREFPLI